MEMDELARKLSFKIAEDKEQEIREGLISLGWLPPEEVTDQSDRIRELEQMRHEVDMRLLGLRNRLQCYHDGTYGRSVVKMHVELKMVSDIEQAINKPEKDAILP